MNSQYTFYLILSSIFSGIIGVFVSNIYHKKHQIKRIKIDLLSDLVGYRYQATNKHNGSQEDFITCLNKIVITYNKSEKVINALLVYKKSKNADDLITLIKRMCDDVKLNYTNFNDSLLNEPFIGNKN